MIRRSADLVETPARPVRTFLDTNVLLYCDDGHAREKRERALELVTAHRARRTGVISLQILQEYFANATRKLGLDAAFVQRKIEVYTRFEVVEPTAADLLAAIDLHRLRQVSIWDAMVLQCAKKAGCRVLLSEDLQHGQTIDGVRIVNPFL